MNRFLDKHTLKKEKVQIREAWKERFITGAVLLNSDDDDFQHPPGKLNVKLNHKRKNFEYDENLGQLMPKRSNSDKSWETDSDEDTVKASASEESASKVPGEDKYLSQFREKTKEEQSERHKEI